MSWLLSPAFAIAGLVLAVVPVLLHLWNRSRVRRVEWAAMELLRESMRERRRQLRIRDILLLVLRVLACLLFGLALAKPAFQGSASGSRSRDPVHAILVVDDSLSMAYRALGARLIDQAKQRAAELIAHLPDGSRVTVLPGARTSDRIDTNPAPSLVDARQAVARIDVVDASLSLPELTGYIDEAAGRVLTPSRKMIVVFSDFQEADWPPEETLEACTNIGTIQLVRLGGPIRENTWVEDLQSLDAVADTRSEVTLRATIAYEGARERRGVLVRFEVDGEVIATRSIELRPADRVPLEFRHRFTWPADARRVHFARLRVSVEPDRLPDDDERLTVLPVVADLPAVFVDGVGGDENFDIGRQGETAHVRRLVASRGSSEARPLLRGEHLRIDQLERDSLRRARVVFLAGVESPRSAVSLLREYVEQGGQLLIAAGGAFDSIAWTTEAWLEGRGILPTPLDVRVLHWRAQESQRGGISSRSEETALTPPTLDVESLDAELFLDCTASESIARELWTEPLFFRRVVSLEGGAVRDAIQVSERARLDGVRRPAGWHLPEFVPEADSGDEAWLQWMPPKVAQATDARTWVSSAMPRVLARYDDGVPFLIERRMGRGSVHFISTGVYSDWSTWTRTNAILLVDRLIRRLVARGIPPSVFEGTRRIERRVSAADRGLAISLTKPDGQVEYLPVTASDDGDQQVVLRSLTKRGHWTLAAEDPQAKDGEDRRLWEDTIAWNGPAAESRLAAWALPALQSRWAGPGCRVDDAASLSDGWWLADDESALERWLLAICLAVLLVEMLVLWLVAGPRFRNKTSARRSRTDPETKRASPLAGGRA